MTRGRNLSGRIVTQAEIERMAEAAAAEAAAAEAAAAEAAAAEAAAAEAAAAAIPQYTAEQIKVMAFMEKNKNKPKAFYGARAFSGAISNTQNSDGFYVPRYDERFEVGYKTFPDFTDDTRFSNQARNIRRPPAQLPPSTTELSPEARSYESNEDYEAKVLESFNRYNMGNFEGGYKQIKKRKYTRTHLGKKKQRRRRYSTKKYHRK
jgi:hypothetical protein